MERRSFYWPSPRPRHYFSLFVFGAVQTLALWPWTKIKGLVLIFPVWAAFEFFYRLRARQSLICPNCGFDPYLYKFDVQLARKKVEEHFAEKKRRAEERKASNVQGALSGNTEVEGEGQ